MSAYCKFHNCSGLTSVTIPNSVTSIGNSAFYSCSGIKEFYITGEEAPTCYPNVFQNVDLTQATLYAPKSLICYCQTTEPWKDFGSIIEFLPGDANQDGSVDVGDIISISNAIHYNQPTIVNLQAADMDSNGLIDENDLSILSTLILSK